MRRQYILISHGCRNDIYQMIICDMFLISAQIIECGYLFKPTQCVPNNLGFEQKYEKQYIPLQTPVSLYKVRGYWGVLQCESWSRCYKTFSCSIQLSMKFQLLIKTKMLKNKDFFCLIKSDDVFILLINVKMPTIVCISTITSRINFMLS